MPSSMIEIAQRYLFPPLYGKVVLALLALAGTALTIGFGADTGFEVNGIISNLAVSAFYKNQSSFWPGLGIFISLVGLALWLFFKVSSPPLPRSQQISMLEDAYRQRGNQDSVCTLFSEVHKVRVSPAELDYLMRMPETSLRARSLKSARAHVELQTSGGFYLKTPQFPYRLSRVVFTSIHFVAVLLCLLSCILVAAAIATSSYMLAARLSAFLLTSGAVAWSAFYAYSGCNNALILTK